MSLEMKPNPFRPRWSKVISDLWDNKMRTMLVVASIAVGVFAIGTIVSATVIIDDDIDANYAAINPVNVELWTDPFEEDLIRIIERTPGVDIVEGRRVLSVRGRRAGESWEGLTLNVIDDFATSELNALATIDGTQFPGSGEIIISQDFMRNTGFQVGDLIELDLPDGSRQWIPVVGLVSDLAVSRPSADINAHAYITRNTFRSFGLVNSYDRLLLTVEGDGGNEDLIAEVAAAVKDRIERQGVAVYRMTSDISTEHPMSTTVLAILGILGALGVLIAILSSSLIVNTLNALLSQHLRQIGVMKLIGGRSSQIIGMYLFLILAYGAIALILAVPAGVIAGFAFARFMAYMLGVVLQGFRIVPLAILLQVVLAFLIPLGAGFFPVRKGARINVRRAITSDRPGANSSQLDLIGRVTRWLRWVSRPILLSIRNTFREWGRLILTLSTLTIAGAVFIAVFNTRASMSTMMEQLMQHFLGDITVTFSQPYSLDRVEQVLLPIPQVKDLEGWSAAGGEIWDANDEVVANISIMGPPPDTQLLNPDIVAGRWILPGEDRAIAVADTIYDYYPDLQPGDELTIKTPGNREEQWRVVGVFRFVSMLGDPLAYADRDFVSGLVNLPNYATSFRVIAEEHDVESQKALSRFIDQYLDDRDFQVDSVEAGQELQEGATQGINILVIFLLMMALLTAVVGSIGLTGTMGMNVLERTREIGVMRAIGAVDWVIIKSVVIEAQVIGLITWVLAIGLSFPISSLLLTIIGEAMMGSTMQLTITSLGMFIWLGVVVLMAIMASILPARNAARLTINEVLSYE